MAGPEQLMVQEMVHSCVCWAGFPVKGQENIFSQCFVWTGESPCVQLETVLVIAMTTKEDGQVICWDGNHPNKSKW